MFIQTTKGVVIETHEAKIEVIRGIACLQFPNEKGEVDTVALIAVKSISDKVI